MNRIVDYYAKRPQVQESLLYNCTGIKESTKYEDVACVRMQSTYVLIREVSAILKAAQ